VEEIESYQGSKYTSETVETIYFGGGTPSLLAPAQIEKTLKAIHNVFEVEAREITFEMNPDDVSATFLSALKELEVSRASMGVQSFQPELLEFMNRAHSSDEALHCLELLSKSNFNSFTVDLIYGNPNQTMKQLGDDIDKLLQFDPPHISAYSLTVESRTRLGKMVELGRIAPPEDDKVADQFDLINERFREQGIRRYEVSNYSKEGCEAVHNSNYWSHRNYLGLGPGAHSFWWDHEAIRWENEKDLRKYLRHEDVREEEVLNAVQLAEERLMMGLRTQAGVMVEELSQKYDYQLNDRQLAYLKQRKTEDKVEVGDRIKLTDTGIKIADAIILDLVTLH
jgi:oxygen-independent coproporphyrinogen-3 oxidase